MGQRSVTIDGRNKLGNRASASIDRRAYEYFVVKVGDEKARESVKNWISEVSEHYSKYVQDNVLDAIVDPKLII